MTSIPEKPSLDGIEARWSKQWEADGTYTFSGPVTMTGGASTNG